MTRFLIFLLLVSAAFAQVNNARMLSGVNYVTATPYLFVGQDASRITSLNNPTGGNATLSSGSTTGFQAGTLFAVQNTGTGPWTILCSSCTINGASAYVLSTGQSVEFYSDGQNYLAASGGAVFSGTQGLSAQPPSQPDLVLAPDPTATCDYPAFYYTLGSVQLCDLGNGVLVINNGSGNFVVQTYRIPTAAILNGSVPIWVQANQDFELSPLLPSAQTGDTLRFNVNGDNAWDAVNMAQEVTGAYGVTGGNPVPFGALCGAVTIAAGTGTGDVFPTATRRGGRTIFITAAASTSTVTGMICGQNGSNSVLPILAWNRFSMLFQGNLSSNIRYWLGLGTFNSGSAAGTNSVAILNSTKYATDTPNSNTLGFRYSTTTDTNWQAVACSAGVACTVVNTGVAYDTNPHTFEMTTNAASTAVCYFIDTVQVTNPCITTNLPPVAGTADSLADMFWTGDNKNNSNTASATFYRMQLSLK